MSTTDLNELQTDITTAAQAVEDATRQIADHMFTYSYELQIAPQVKRAVQGLEDLKRLERSRRQTYADAIIALENYKK